MGLFDKIGSAKIYGSSKFFDEGMHTVEINKVLLNKGHKGTSFIIECTIITTTGELKPGTTCAQIQKMDGDKRDLALSTIKQFIQACVGDEVEGYTDAEWKALADSVVSDEQPLAGLKMKLETFLKPTRAGGMFTNHKWLHPVE